MVFDSGLLRTFQAVAQNRSFTRAADQLNLTQSAVSAQIQRLEEQAGVPLLTRNTRHVSLTRHGEVLLGYARAILHLNGSAFEQLRGQVQDVTVRIGATDDLMCGWLPEVLWKFRCGHPHTSLEVRVSNAGLLLANMDEGELDLVLGCRCRGDQSGEVLWREDLVWASSTDSIDSDMPLPLALFPDPCPYRDAALAALAAAGREWRIATLSASVGALRSAVTCGLAVSPLNRSALIRGMRALGPKAGLPKLPAVEFVLYVRAQSASPEIAALAQAIRHQTW